MWPPLLHTLDQLGSVRRKSRKIACHANILLNLGLQRVQLRISKNVKEHKYPGSAWGLFWEGIKPYRRQSSKHNGDRYFVQCVRGWTPPVAKPREGRRIEAEYLATGSEEDPGPDPGT